MELLFFQLKDLVPFAENPRIADTSDHVALRESFQRFGMFKPLLIWRGTDHPDHIHGPIVIGGNQRLITLLGMQEKGLFRDGPLTITLDNGHQIVIDPNQIPCVPFPGSWREAKAVALRDNAQEGEWDYDTLPSYMEDLKNLFGDAEFDLALTGFDAQTISDLSALASDPLVGLDQFGEEEESEKVKKKKEADEDTSFLTRQGARVVIGNIRGKIPVELYERLASLVKSSSGRLGSTELTPILEAWATALEKWSASLEKPQVSKAPAPNKPARRRPAKEKSA